MNNWNRPKNSPNIWKSKRLALKTKIKLYNSNVKSVLLYRAECWKTVETEINQLNAFHNICLRRICNTYWPNKISNDELYAKIECYSRATEVKHWRLRWLGHVLRMAQKRIPKKVLRWNLSGKRRHERPKITLKKNLWGRL